MKSVVVASKGGWLWLTPLYHSTVGFDRLPSLLSHALQRDESGFPPYNIEKIGDDAYAIVMALAGFGRDDIEIVTEQNRLTIRGLVKDKNEKTYLHRGLAPRTFTRVFDLADYVEVMDATMEDGLLVVSLKRELPEKLKPRSIQVNGGTSRLQAANDKAA